MCAGKRILAVSENFGTVVQCGCGSVHVTVGPVSVALDSETLQKLHRLLGAAIQRIESDELTETESVYEHSSHLALRRVVKLKH
jgi:hypothetical protein